MRWSSRQIGDTIQDVLDAVFFFPGGEFPYRNVISSVYKTKGGYLKIDDDYAKKVITNTIAKCLSMIGFGADVYMGQFDCAEYMAELYGEQVQLVTPDDIGKLLKGMNYYSVPKDEILKHFNISHIKDLPRASMSECEALIKKLSKKEK